MFLVFILIGALAQLVDGALGMGFGLTSSTFLVLTGSTPVAASAVVHTAEIGTTLASGLSHWRAGNVDRVLLRRLALPGALGALFGAFFLASVSLSAARPVTASILLGLGVLLCLRFGLGVQPFLPLRDRGGRRMLSPLGVFAGFLDAAGGGGWGPVVTPTMLTLTRTRPAVVVGTVSAAEFLVALFASAGFLLGAGLSGQDPAMLLALLLGGVCTAPLAARLAARLRPELFGALIGLFVVFTNMRLLLLSVDAPGAALPALAVALLVLGLPLLRRAYRRDASVTDATPDASFRSEVPVDRPSHDDIPTAPLPPSGT